MEDNSTNRNNFKNGQKDAAHYESRRPSTGNTGRPGPSTKPDSLPSSAQNQQLQRKRPHPDKNVKAPCKELDAVDRIWHDIDVEQREKMARRKEEAKRRERPAPSPQDYLPLTLNNLKNFKNDDSTVSDFINREGMVDKLLGYKMLFGRMENCGTLGYEKMSDVEVQELSEEWRQVYTQNGRIEKQVGRKTLSPKKVENEEGKNSGSEASFPNRPRQGPKTPPGSPGQTNSADQTTVNRRELIEQLAKNFGMSACKVEETLGNGLDKALEDCSKKIKNELMETFKDQLQNKIERKQNISDDLSDQMELVSEDSLSIDMKIPKKEESKDNMYHMVIPPPPIPPIMPPYQYYHQNAPAVYQYAPPPPPPPPQQTYQQNVSYPPPSQPLVPNAPPPPIHYQMPHNQHYQQMTPASTIVLPPVNVPPPPIGVRIDTPMPQTIPPVIQTLPPTGMPPPPIQTKIPPPPIPQQIQTAPPPSMPPTSFNGDCWRSGPPVAHPSINSNDAWQQPAHPGTHPADAWQQQPSHPAASPAVTVPVSTDPTVVNVQSTLFSALGLHKFPPPPPPPPPPVSGNSNSIPFSSLSSLPPPPPPPVAGPSPPCGSLNFVPQPPPIHQSNIDHSFGQSGYRHHGHNNNRKSHYQNSYSNNF
uniref:Trithorax group protein osa n=1 Tax=Caenorhabditis tropicalis TaxID=1561998 RepID=A0A1I7ULD6_9PELO